MKPAANNWNKEKSLDVPRRAVPSVIAGKRRGRERECQKVPSSSALGMFVYATAGAFDRTPPLHGEIAITRLTSKRRSRRECAEGMTIAGPGHSSCPNTLLRIRSGSTACPQLPVRITGEGPEGLARRLAYATTNRGGAVPHFPLRRAGVLAGPLAVLWLRVSRTRTSAAVEVFSSVTRSRCVTLTVRLYLVACR